MSKAQAIEKALERVFQESEIEIVNDSESHRGHGGYSDGETHFKLIELLHQNFSQKLYN